MSRALRLALVVVLAACGDDSSNQMIDAAPQPDTATPDAAFSGCDYNEQADLANDDIDTGTPEATGQTFSTSTVVCGVFDENHYDTDFGIVDVDAYTVALAAEGDVLVRVHAKGTAVYELIGVDIRDAASALVGKVTLYGDHGVTSLHLSAGTYTFEVFALAGMSVTTPTAYKLSIATDTPSTRCAEVTTGGYTEANDGGQNNGNDVLMLAVGSSTPALTSSSTDMPEPASFVIAPAFSIRAAGTAANINTPDQYEDKDTYAFATGTGTNELTIRVTWPTTGTDIDWMLFEANNVDPVVRATSNGTDGTEMLVTSVKPSTSYWLWIAAAVGTTVPADYNATLCGATFAPPM